MGKQSGKGSTRSFALLCVASFFMYGVNNVMISLAPLAVMGMGASAAAAGFQGTFFIVFAIVLRTVLMPLTSRIGTKRLMILGAASFAAASALFPFCATYGAFLTARAVQAAGLAVFWPLSVSSVVDVSDADNVGRRLGVSRFATSASMAVGPYAAFALGDAMGAGWLYGALLLASCLAIVALAACKLPGDAHGEGGGASGKPRAARARRGALARFEGGGLWLAGGLLVTLVDSAAAGLVMHFSAIAVGEFDGSLNAASYLSLYSIGGMIASLLLGRALDRGKCAIVLPVCIASFGLGVLQLGLPHTSFAGLAAGGVLAGVGNMGVALCCMDIITRRAPLCLRDTALGYRQSCVDIGIAVAATAFGAAFDAAPANYVVFLAWGAIMLCFAAAVCANIAHAARKQRG